jgi:hypothetical protein
MHAPADADEGVGILVKHVLERDDDALEVPRATPFMKERGEGGD